jgi:hypothetical protein
LEGIQKFLHLPLCWQSTRGDFLGYSALCQSLEHTEVLILPLFNDEDERLTFVCQQL